MERIFSLFVIVLISILISGVAFAAEVTYDTKDSITKAIPADQTGSVTKHMKKKGKRHKSKHKKFSKMMDTQDSM